LAVISIVGGVILQLASAFALIGAILLGVLVLAMHLLAVPLKQIMDRA
jgi:hypothetical protein